MPNHDDTTTSQLIPFQFENHSISVIRDDKGEPWWFAKEICDILDISDPSGAVLRLDSDEKSTYSTRNQLIINEFGLYSLVLSSRKSEAKKFRRWVTHDVIPAIRKTGKYGKSRKSLEPKPLTPAQRRKEEIKLAYVKAMAQVRIDIAQERFDRLASIPVQTVPLLPPPRQSLSIIQWLLAHKKRTPVALENALGVRATKLSKEHGRNISQVADRRWKNADGSWKTIGAYDEDMIDLAWKELHPAG